MSTQTVILAEEGQCQSYPMSELRRAPSAVVASNTKAIDDPETSPPPRRSKEPVKSENHVFGREPSTTPVFKLCVAGFSFFCAGVNDGVLGPLIPYIIRSFGIGTGEVAIM